MDVVCLSFNPLTKQASVGNHVHVVSLSAFSDEIIPAFNICSVNGVTDFVKCTLKDPDSEVILSAHVTHVSTNKYVLELEALCCGFFIFVYQGLL